jgi:isopenicillin-N N-acyltransferase like protein
VSFRRPVLILGLLLGLMAFVPSHVPAAEPPFRYPVARYKQAELRYLNGLPVLRVQGSPADIGEQEAALTVTGARAIMDYPRELLKRINQEDQLPRLTNGSRLLLPQVPADHLVELQAFADKAAINREMLSCVNVMVDLLMSAFGCSSLMIEPQRSATKGTLFGRNLDFFTLGSLQQYSLVTVYRPQGKHAFASIGFPGIVGCLSGMNDAGLALATHEVFSAGDGSPMFNPRGIPYLLLFRRILEECTTIEEAEKLLKSVERTTLFNLALCDRRGAAVAEVTPRSVVLRHGEGGICACTNHFRTDQLATLMLSPRYWTLMGARDIAEPGVADVAKKLTEVGNRRMTLQTMIFEPAVLRLHLALGECPTSSLPLKSIDLAPLLKAGPWASSAEKPARSAAATSVKAN